jgi:trehalose/maltose hydrolase-like predicted phosphorylase
MAKTYYNYAERDVNSMIDWSQVGKNLTDMLTEQASLRQNKRQALEQASNDFGKVVSDTPTGLSESWNNRTLDFANNAQEQRKLDDSLFCLLYTSPSPRD